MVYRSIFVRWIKCRVVSARKMNRKTSKWRPMVAILDLTPFWMLSDDFSLWHHPAFDLAYENTYAYQILQFIYKNSLPNLKFTFSGFFPCLIMTSSGISSPWVFWSPESPRVPESPNDIIQSLEIVFSLNTQIAAINWSQKSLCRNN